MAVKWAQWITKTTTPASHPSQMCTTPEHYRRDSKMGATITTTGTTITTSLAATTRRTIKGADNHPATNGQPAPMKSVSEAGEESTTTVTVMLPSLP